ncbi:MAG: DUF3943 domain-containing protein [Bacteriovorax sp.]|nr:DUF3943 domain-containing protein [Bacteriovorax sp.]
MKAYLFLAALFLMASFSVHANPLAKKILISVGDLKDNKSKEWKKATCLQVYGIANQIADNGADITCREFNTDNFADKDLSTLSRSFDYHLRIMRTLDGQIIVDVTNWHRHGDSDFKTLGWNFKDPSPETTTKITKEDAFARVIGNFFLYTENELAYKAGLLANGAFESNEIRYDEKAGLFIDKRTEKPLSINQAVNLFENESPRKKNYLRTGIEIGVQLSAAMAIYYKNLVFNQVDFDYTLKSGLKGKYVTGDAIRFDDNDKTSNYGHTYAGVMYYQTARANGFNSLESALITFASSTAWETFEYHEVLSINDELLTPVGGYVIGEATYQIACALISKNNPAAKILGYIIDPNLAYNHAIDKAYYGDKYRSQPDCKKSRWSDISVFVGLESGQKAYEPSKNSDFIAGLEATVINISDYDKAGKGSKLVTDTAMTKMIVEANGNQGLIDLRVITQITMAAYNQKNLTKDEKGQLRGYDLLLGIGSASTWNDHGGKELSADENFYGTVNILGATAHIDAHYNGFNIRADIGVYGDFAMVKSYSLEKYKAGTGGNLSRESSVIQRKQYYWGAGASAIAAISVSKGRWETGYFGQHATATSIDSRNRIESTSGAVFKDSIHINKLYVSFAMTKNLKLQLSREYNIRSGTANGEYASRGVETRTMGTLIYKF